MWTFSRWDNTSGLHPSTCRLSNTSRPSSFPLTAKPASEWVSHMSRPDLWCAVLITPTAARRARLYRPRASPDILLTFQLLRRLGKTATIGLYETGLGVAVRSGAVGGGTGRLARLWARSGRPALFAAYTDRSLEREQAQSGLDIPHRRCLPAARQQAHCIRDHTAIYRGHAVRRDTTREGACSRSGERPRALVV